MPVRGATPVVAPEENRVISETMARARTPRFTILVVVLAGIAGCLRSDRVRSTGAVTFDDRPVETGAITFVPLDRGQAPEAAPIVGGRYALEGKTGRRRVEIRGTRRLDDSRIPKTMPRLEGVPLYEDYIPSAYNAASTLEINVTAAGPNVFDFDLKSSP
jgi:hypothetical protein